MTAHASTADWRYPVADPAPRRPSFPMPAGACDCHAHVFGPASRYPYVAGRAYTPPDQLLEQYLAMLDATGLRQGVLSQPSIYGTDNTCLVDALHRSSGRLRGIVVLDPATTDAALDALDRAGVVGVRVNAALPGGLPLSMLDSLAERIAPLGWHLEVIVEAVDTLVDLAPRLGRLRLPVVIEQMGTIRAPQPLAQPGFSVLAGMLAERGNVWAKLSHPYKISQAGLPYADTTPYARHLLARGADRLLWGSDWPHPRVPGAMPNDGALLDLLLDWTERDVALAHRVLATNPVEVYALADPPVAGTSSTPVGGPDSPAADAA